MLTSYRISVLAALLALGPALAGAATADGLKEGEPFPAWQEFSLQGDLSPEALDGKVLLVDFWASWCPPCRASFPVFTELQSRFGKRGFQVVAVSVDTTRRAYETFVGRMKPGFTTVWDAEQALVARVKVPTMPTSYLVDRSGRVRFIHEGFSAQQSRGTYVEQIEELLEEKP